MVSSQVEVSKSVTNVLIALGANLPSRVGSPQQTLLAAVREIGRENADVQALSHCYQTPCFPAGAGPDYVNAAVRLTTFMSDISLMARLHEIEAQFGRTRTERWGARGLDLDLIAYGDKVIPDRATYDHWQKLSPSLQAQAAPDGLVVPHPRLQDRGFVLVPLQDIAPNWKHPVTGKTVTRMLDDLGQAGRADITAIDWPE